MNSSEGRDRLAAEKKIFQAAGGAGLPTTYIGRNVIVGYDVERYKRVIANGDPGSFSLPVWALFVLTSLAIGWAVFSSLRALENPARGDEPDKKAPPTVDAPDSTNEGEA